ncbi:M23 family metallopeptidase [Blastochloris tepida]|nr:M23 family metallopeptidase [Blastochloris tepida]
MGQATRGARGRRMVRGVEIGIQPPLGLREGRNDADHRRRVSVRWFAATILTGLCGAGLMGGAVYASLDDEYRFAAPPETVQSALRGPIASTERNTLRKGDRVELAVETSSARNTQRIPVSTKIGDREIFRQRPFTRVATNLVQTTTSLSNGIPPFNPLRLQTDQVFVRETLSQEPDGDLAITTREFGTLASNVKLVAALSTEEVMAQVREALAGRARPGSLPPVPAAALAGERLAYANDGSLQDVFSSFVENMTTVGKTASENTGGTDYVERTVMAKRGETIVSILADQGTALAEAREVVKAFGRRGRDGAIDEGARLRILMAPAPNGKGLQVLRVSVFGEHGHEGSVALSDLGRWVQVEAPREEPRIAASKAPARDDDDDEEDDGRGVRLYQSIYETALRQQVPRQVVEDLIRIYAYDVDFQKRVRAGDSFDVLYAEDAAAEGRSEVLFASLTIGGETRRYYRFLTSDDQVIDYYDESAKSAKKFLMRKPMEGGTYSRGYGMRRHPILGYVKMHAGVDWAAPHGTPIYAAGNGVVEKAGWESGYGKYVRLRHNNGYESAYGHMSGFARGITEGSRVRQGQLIGFVGSTGLSTGPHLHYEVIVNNRTVDPLRVKLPRGRSLEGRFLAEFERERERINQILESVGNPARVAATSGRRG